MPRRSSKAKSKKVAASPHAEPGVVNRGIRRCRMTASQIALVFETRDARMKAAEEEQRRKEAQETAEIERFISTAWQPDNTACFQDFWTGDDQHCLRYEHAFEWKCEFVDIFGRKLSNQIREMFPSTWNPEIRYAHGLTVFTASGPIMDLLEDGNPAPESFRLC